MNTGTGVPKMLKRIYILRQAIEKNLAEKPERSKMYPPVMLDIGDGKGIACHEVVTHGEAYVIYDPEAPKALPGDQIHAAEEGRSLGGAKVYIETSGKVTAFIWTGSGYQKKVYD